MTTPEGNLSNNIAKELRKLKTSGEPIHYRKVWGTAAARAGEPDWDILYYGKAVKVEAKAEDNEPSKLQEHTMDKIRRAGGITGVVRSVDELRTKLDEAREAAINEGWTGNFPTT